MHGEEIMEGPSGQRRTAGMLCSEMPLLLGGVKERLQKVRSMIYLP